MKKMIKGLALSLVVLLLVSACSSKPTVDTPKPDGEATASLSAIHEKIKAEFGEDYVANMPLDADMLESVIGVQKADVKEFIAEMPMMSSHVDTFIAVEANEGKADAVEASLLAYQKNMVEQSMQYPGNIAKVNASKVVRHGDFVFFLLLGAFDDNMDSSEEEQLVFAQAEVKKAEDVIAGFFN